MHLKEEYEKLIVMTNKKSNFLLVCLVHILNKFKYGKFKKSFSLVNWLIVDTPPDIRHMLVLSDLLDRA